MAPLPLGAAVQYYSASHGCWIDAKVEAVRENGDVQISCKKNVWLSLADQQRLRVLPPAGVPPPPAPRTPKASEEAAAAGGPKAAVAKAAEASSGDWAADQAIGLGAHGAEGMGPWAQRLDRSAVSSVHLAAEKLNRGDLALEEPGGAFCVVYSSSSAAHYLLYRKGFRDKALSHLLQHLREAAAGAAAAKEELRRLRIEVQQLAQGREAAERPEVPKVTVDRAWKARLGECQSLMQGLRKELLEAQEQLRAAEEERGRIRLEQEKQREEQLLQQGEREQRELTVAALRAELREQRGQAQLLRGERDALQEKASKGVTSSLMGKSAECLSNFLQAAEEELSLQTALEGEREQRQQLEARIKQEVSARESAQAELDRVTKQLLTQKARRPSVEPFREQQEAPDTLPVAPSCSDGSGPRAPDTDPVAAPAGTDPAAVASAVAASAEGAGGSEAEEEELQVESQNTEPLQPREGTAEGEGKERSARPKPSLLEVEPLDAADAAATSAPVTPQPSFGDVAVVTPTVQLQ